MFWRFFRFRQALELTRLTGKNHVKNCGVNPTEIKKHALTLSGKRIEIHLPGLARPHPASTTSIIQHT